MHQVEPGTAVRELAVRPVDLTPGSPVTGPAMGAVVHCWPPPSWRVAIWSWMSGILADTAYRLLPGRTGLTLGAD